MNHIAVKMFPGEQQEIDKKKTSTLSNKLVENASWSRIEALSVFAIICVIT